MHRRCFTLVCLLVVVPVSSFSQGPDVVGASGVLIERRIGGRLWAKGDGTFTFETLARLLSPVLWIAADEPLRSKGVEGPIPLPIPNSASAAATNVVYYRIHSVTLRSLNADSDALRAKALTTAWSFDVSDDDEILDARSLVEVVIRFYFYYPEDLGFGAHAYDLEALEVHLEVGPNPEELRIARIVASAHGVSWFTNEARIDPSAVVVLPLHAFVEAGKHATAPDLDGDGTYQHGRDVNTFVRDSWGVRDVNPLTWFGAGRFSESMFTPRSRRHVSAPAWNPAKDGGSLYQLVWLDDARVCRDGLPAIKLPEFLRYVGNEMNLCSQTAIRERTGPNALVRAFRVLRPVKIEPFMSRPMRKSTFLAYSYRWDGTGQLSITMPLWRLPRTAGVVSVRSSVPTKSFFHSTPLRPGETRATDLLYSPSVALGIDPYVALGADMSGEPTVTTFAFESGARFGVSIPGFSLTVRGGFRTSVVNQRRENRPVVQVSLGVW
jgi:hypothetical protein